MIPERQPPDRWQKIERLYHAALKMEPGQRAAFLAEACASDDAMLREVASLILAHEQAGDFIEGTPDQAAAQMLEMQRMTFMAEQWIGRYQLISLLGAGGMGQVWRAKDSLLDREVAIKILTEHLAQNTEALSRFKIEARAVAALSHPNILAIYDFGVERGVPFAVTELLSGETLRSRLAGSTLDWRKSAEYGLSLAEGLSAAHEKGIVHRDLKPENIFLTTAGQLKILDFGVARVKRAVSPPEVAGTTQPGIVLGTVGYMSPEQIRGEEAEAPSDTFSFGCVLYEMVAGHRLFAGATTAETMAAILKDDPPFLPKAGQPVPAELEQLISRCLQKQPAKRYPSGKELALDLRAILGGMGSAKSAAPSGSASRLRRAVWVGALSSLLLIVTFSALWWQPGLKPQQHSAQRLVSSFPGAPTAATFSPDASTIAFLMPDAAGVPQIWIKNLAQGNPIQVTFDRRGAGAPQWSPKNDQIIFSRIEPGWHLIWSVPPLGGPLHLLVDRSASHPEGGRDPSFSWDGSRIVFTRADQIWIANADGSNQQRVQNVAPTPGTPTFSPDGSLIAYVRTEGGPLGDIWIIPSENGQPRQLTFDFMNTGKPVWRSDGKHIIFSSDRGGSQTLWEIPVNGGEPQPVLVSAGEDGNPQISRDGGKLIYSTTRNLHTLTILDPVTQQKRELHEVPNEIGGPVFSPAGDKIAFVQTVEGGSHLFTIDAEGRSLTQVTKGERESNNFPRWSWDGSALYFYQRRPTPSLRRTSLKGGPSEELVRGWTINTHWLVHIDPQEKLIAHSQWEDGLRRNTFLREIATGRETLFRKLMYEPQWSKDGQWILGTEVNSGTRGDWFGDIMVCRVATGQCRKIANRGNRPIWSHDESRIYFHRFGGPNRALFSVSIDGTDEKLVAVLRPMTPYNNFSDVSPKGEVAYVQFKAGKPELWMMELRN
jgi:serine/threonine protein kinase/Tol biopolymer transport system component